MLATQPLRISQSVRKGHGCLPGVHWGRPAQELESAGSGTALDQPKQDVTAREGWRFSIQQSSANAATFCGTSASSIGYMPSASPTRLLETEIMVHPALVSAEEASEFVGGRMTITTTNSDTHDEIVIRGKIASVHAIDWEPVLEVQVTECEMRNASADIRDRAGERWEKTSDWKWAYTLWHYVGRGRGGQLVMYTQTSFLPEHVVLERPSEECRESKE